MKKIFILLVAFIGLNACSSDNDTPAPVNTDDVIVGTWKLTGTTEQNGTGPVIVRNLSACDLLQTETYKNNNTAEVKFYSSNSTGGCNLVQTSTATWSKGQNNYYTITVSGSNGYTVTGTRLFSNNNNTQTATFLDGTYTITQTFARQ